MASFTAIKQRNRILSQIADAKRNNPFGGAAPPVEGRISCPYQPDRVDDCMDRACDSYHSCHSR